MKITYGISSSGNPQWIATGGNSTNGNDIGFSSDGKVWTAIFVNTATGFNSYITMITVSKEPKTTTKKKVQKEIARIKR